MFAYSFIHFLSYSKGHLKWALFFPEGITYIVGVKQLSDKVDEGLRKSKSSISTTVRDSSLPGIFFCFELDVQICKLK